MKLWNKRGFIDLEEFNPAMVILPVIGLVVGFIVSNGFSPSPFFRIITALICGVVGFVWAYLMDN